MMDVHRLMMEQGVEQDSVSYNIVLNTLTRMGRIRDVGRYWALMRKVLLGSLMLGFVIDSQNLVKSSSTLCCTIYVGLTMFVFSISSGIRDSFCICRSLCYTY